MDRCFICNFLQDSYTKRDTCDIIDFFQTRCQINCEILNHPQAEQKHSSLNLLILMETYLWLRPKHVFGILNLDLKHLGGRQPTTIESL